MRPTTFLVTALVALLLSQGTAQADEKAPAAPVPAVKEMEGRLLVVRGLRQGEPQFTDARGNRYLLGGKWRGELLRLDGHVVKVWGKPGEKMLMTPTLTVERYEILGSGYGIPVVGQLRLSASGALTLVQAGTDDGVKLTGSASMLRRLRKREGCKIWFVGRKATKGATRVRSFGWLSCPAPAVKKPQEIKTPGKKPPATSPEPRGSKKNSQGG